MTEPNDLIFKVTTPLGFKVTTSKNYWEYITTVKHPIVRGMESDVIGTLENPDSIRQSKTDEKVHMFYREIKYHNKNYHILLSAHLVWL